MTMTAANLRIKIYDKKSKQNQYETESGMAELKTGLNELSAIAMKESYQKVFDTYVTVNASTDGLTNTFDKLYLNRLMTLLTNGAYTGGPYSSSGYEYSVDVLQSYLSATNDVGNEIRSNFTTLNPAGENQIDFPWAESGFSSDCEHYILLRNVTMRCKNEQGYQTTVTTDIRMDCPAVFFASSGIYPEYTQYSLIADDTLIFNGAGLTDGYTVKGNVYAGAGKTHSTASQSGPDFPIAPGYPYKGVGGIQIINGTRAKIIADTIITRSNLSSYNNTTFEIEGGSGDRKAALWAENIETVFDSISNNRTPSAAKLDIRGVCNVSDDLQLNAHNSQVKVEGDYNGFSYNRNENLDEEYTDARYSSAIMVNGQNSNLDFSDVDRISLAGRSFISRTLTSRQSVAADESGGSGQDILTGEVITIKSNQMAYLIPDEYIRYGHNPVLKSELEGKPTTLSAVLVDEIRTEDPDLYDMLSCSVTTSSALATDTVGDGYTAFYYNSGDEGMVPVVYYYFEFRNQEKANEYFKKYYQGHKNSLENLATQFNGSIRIKESAINNVFANIYYKDGSGMKMAPSTGFKPSTSQISNTISTAREYYSRELALIADYDGAGTDYRFEDSSGNAEDKGQKRLYDLLIDRKRLVEDATDGGNPATWGFDSDGVKKVEIPDRGAYVYIVDNYGKSTVQTNVLCGSGESRGIIVTTGDLILNTKFTGLIITGGQLTVNPSGQATADKRMVQFILKYIVAQEKAAREGTGDPEWLNIKSLSQYFLEYEAKDSLTAVDLIDVSKFNYYENWMKNKDE